MLIIKEKDKIWFGYKMGGYELDIVDGLILITSNNNIKKLDDTNIKRTVMYIFVLTKLNRKLNAK